MAISEAKVKIVIDNYFPKECNVNTSICEAFEKGFRLGMQKAATAVRARWNRYVHDKELWANYCSACNTYLPPGMDWEPNFCPNCGADMREEANYD